jgi:hypothetical protein
MFGCYDALAAGNDLYARLARDSRSLVEMIAEVDALRSQLGYTEPEPLCARYLEYRRKKGPNDLGEGKLSRLFLAELDS